MSIITVRGLSKVYGKENPFHAIKKLDLDIEEGEFVAIMGASGSGKSTLLHMLGALDKPTEGKITINGLEITAMKDESLASYRRQKVGFIFQGYNLIPILNVFENIVLPAELDGLKPDKAMVEELTSFLGIKNKLNSMPSILSGGEQQRVAIARAMYTKPSIVLADEPTGNLDSKASSSVVELLKSTTKRVNQTVVLVTHDPTVAEKADRTITMSDGVIVGLGK